MLNDILTYNVQLGGWQSYLFEFIQHASIYSTT